MVASSRFVSLFYCFWNEWRAPLIVGSALLGIQIAWCSVFSVNYIFLRLNPVTANSLQRTLHGVSSAITTIEAEKSRRPLAVIAGASMLSYDLDYTILTENLKSNWNLMLLGGKACGLDCFGQALHLMKQHALIPDLIVLMVHPFEFRKVQPHSERPNAMTRQVRTDHWKTLFFPANERERYQAFFKKWLITMQFELQKIGFRFPPVANREEQFQPLNEWTAARQSQNNPTETPHTRMFANQNLQNSYRRWRSKGFFSTEQYQPDQPNLHSETSRIEIERLRQNGSRVFVLLSPLHSLARDSFPANAYASLSETFNSYVGRPVGVINMVDAIPDQWMHDVSHANPMGQQHFSTAMAKTLDRLIESNYRIYPRLDTTETGSLPSTNAEFDN